MATADDNVVYMTGMLARMGELSEEMRVVGAGAGTADDDDEALLSKIDDTFQATMKDFDEALVSVVAELAEAGVSWDTVNDDGTAQSISFALLKEDWDERAYGYYDAWTRILAEARARILLKRKSEKTAQKASGAANQADNEDVIMGDDGRTGAADQVDTDATLQQAAAVLQIQDTTKAPAGKGRGRPRTTKNAPKKAAVAKHAAPKKATPAKRAAPRKRTAKDKAVQAEAALAALTETDATTASAKGMRTRGQAAKEHATEAPVEQAAGETQAPAHGKKQPAKEQPVKKQPAKKPATKKQPARKPATKKQPARKPATQRAKGTGKATAAAAAEAATPALTLAPGATTLLLAHLLGNLARAAAGKLDA